MALPQTFTAPALKRTWFRDIDGMITFFKDEDSAQQYNIDWTDEMDDTGVFGGFDTSTWESSGVTIGTTSSTAGVTTAFVSGTDGWVKNTVTTAAGNTYIRKLRFVGYDRRVSGDYR